MNVIYLNNKTLLAKSFKELLSTKDVVITAEFSDEQSFKELEPSIIQKAEAIVVLETDTTNLLHKFCLGIKNIPVLFVTVNNASAEQLFVKMTGVVGILLTNSCADELDLAINSLKNNQTFYTSSLSQSIQKYIPQGKKISSKLPKLAGKLSPREREVIKLAMSGMQSKQIGKILDISPRTVDKHRANSMQKCNAKNIVELISHIQSNNIML
jgi:DNA-binding NarL/FixJ family response regulator